MSLWKVSGKMVEPQAQEPSVQGKHDKLVSSNHQTPPHWKTVEQWYLPHTYHREGGREGRELTETGKAHLRMSWPQKQSCKIMQPPADPWPLCMPTTGEVAN